jgi:hypothetical protein
MVKTEVYYNLHKHLFSLRQQGRVIAHMGTLGLSDVSFHVQPAGQAKVRATGRKNVHAYVKGFYDSNLVMVAEYVPDTLRAITYNPYKFDTFVYADDLTPVKHCAMLYLRDRKIYEIMG